MTELERLRIENECLREMVEANESTIHGEWGVGPREPYDWLPDLEMAICEKTTGHESRRGERPHPVVGTLPVDECALCGQVLRWVLRTYA